MIFILTILYNIPREIFLQAEELFYSKNWKLITRK